MSRFKWISLGAGGALAAAGLVAWALTTPASPARPTTTPTVVAPLAKAPAVAAPVTTPAGAPASAEVRFEPARELAFRLKSEASITLDGLPVGDARAVPVSLSLSATCHLTPLRATAESTIAAGHLTDVVVVGPGLSPSTFGAPFLVEVGHDGRLLRFARGAQTPASEARRVQALLWELQFSTRADAAFAGENADGAYLAAVTVTDQGLHVERALTAWTQRWAGSPADDRPNGLLVVQRSGQGWFDLAQSRARVAGGDVRFEARRVEAPPAPLGDVREEDFVWEDLLPRAFRHRVSSPVTRADLERRARVAPLPLETVMADFDQRAAGKGYIAESWKDLSAYFEVHPDAIATSLARLRARQMPATSIAVFYTALGKARTPVAREALLAIRRDEKEPPMDRVRATFNLLDRDDVGVPLAKELALESLTTPPENTHAARFLRGEALLALGMMGGIREEPEVGTLTHATLRQVLADRALPTPVRRAALKAVGNTGAPELLPLVVEPSKDPNIHVRMAAAHAFRRMPVRDAEAQELEWLSREGDRFVRAELWGVIRSQHFDARVGASEALTKVALADLATTKSPLDRRTLIRFVAQGSMARDPAVRAALKAQARYEYLHDSPALNEFTDVLSNEEVSEVLK